MPRFSSMLIAALLGCGQSWVTELTALWPTLIEVVNITQTHGGPEPDSFSERISEEAIRKWNEFAYNRSDIEADGLNDAFFRYQLRMYDRTDSTTVYGSSTDETPNGRVTWPEMQSLAEYRKMRHYIAKFGKRYLDRLGYDTSKNGFNIFSWAAVQSHSDYHGPHTHTGELLVGVYYARVTRNSGRLRLFDPRGTIPPFGKTYDFDCQSGQMIFFPSWLQHAALTTKAKDGDHRVIFAFNIGVGGGIGEMRSLDWHMDPVSGYQFTQHVPVSQPEPPKLLPNDYDRNLTRCEDDQQETFIGSPRIEL